MANLAQRFAKALPTGVRKWYFNACRYNRYGLYYEDTFRVTPVVEEAIKRLPEDEQNARVFRIRRALDLSLKHRVLPQEQWTKFEEERTYLQPYIDQVQQENSERREWNTR
ncbi:cytochrome b-c1 complex subunit 7-like [Amphiura filiformis]|uniref:cytochrome b-c1 complex subunit 7-like n=1 Tax=Amphiura filiformis TaxID=82378 RepID=UPI003B211191